MEKNDNKCNNSLLRAVAGAQPSALQTMFFMVVPYQTIPASGGMSAKTFILPLGPVSDAVADVVGYTHDHGSLVCSVGLVCSGIH